MKKLIIAMVLLFMACGGQDGTEANIASQSFIDDFGTPYIKFVDGGCNTSITVSTSGGSVYTLRKQNGGIYSLYGIDREVIKNVGIRYETENFSITKYFDNSIVMKYDDVVCKTTIY